MPCQAIKTCKYQIKQYISFEYWEKTPPFYKQQQHKLQEIAGFARSLSIAHIPASIYW